MAALKRYLLDRISKNLLQTYQLGEYTVDARVGVLKYFENQPLFTQETVNKSVLICCFLELTFFLRFGSFNDLRVLPTTTEFKPHLSHLSKISGSNVICINTI